MKPDRLKVPGTRQEFIEMVRETLARDRALIKEAEASIRKLAKIKSRESRSSIALWKSCMDQAERDIRGQERLLKRMGVADPDE